MASGYVLRAVALYTVLAALHHIPLRLLLLLDAKPLCTRCANRSVPPEAVALQIYGKALAYF